MKRQTIDMEEIKEIVESDADIETKYNMISNILTAKPHYFEKQEPCEDAVSREAAQEAAEKVISKYIPILIGRFAEIPLELALAIKDLPPVKPKGVTVTDFADKCRECGKQEKSEWVFEKTKFDKYGCTAKCPSCHKKWKTYDEIRWKKENKFCPNCGTGMESEDDSN